MAAVKVRETQVTEHRKGEFVISIVLESYRGDGLGKWLMECIISHPCLQGLRRWSLATMDAHGLYAQWGFTPLKTPERFMELHNPDVYKRDKNLRG